MNYKFDYSSNWNTDKIEKFVLSFPEKPTINQVKEALKEVKARYKEGSNVNLYNPVKGIIYYSVIGWTATYNVVLTDDKDEQFLRPFADEPTGKYAKGRRVFTIKS